MHILIDARMYSPQFTGIGRYVYEIVQEFFTQKPDWDFTLFLGEAEYEKFDISSLQKKRSGKIQKILAPEKIYSGAEQTTFLSKISNVEGDLIWFPHFNVPILCPKKFVVTVHDLTLSKFPGKKHSLLKNIIYKSILKNALMRSEKIFTVSGNTQSDLVKDEHVNPEKILVAGNAVGEEFTNFSPDKIFWENTSEILGIEKPFFLYTGQWRSHKNILGMLKAFHLFIQKNGKIAQLVITGKDNPLYPEFLEYRAEHNLEEDVIPVGLVPEKTLLHLYHHAKSYVFPSFYEGFGIPPLEAMAVSTPVIASNASCIPEVCGDACEYFNPENIPEISEKMQNIFFDEDLQEELIEKGLQQIKKFSWADSAQKILEEMEKID